MTELHKRANRHPKYKTAYRVKNWAEYDKALRDRRDITLWISQDAIDSWTPPQIGKRGAQPVYSDLAIETALSLRLLFDLPSRQTEGFLHSLLTLMNLALPCPDHTTLSRRYASEHLLAIESEGRFAWKRTSGSTRRVTPRTPLRGSNGRSATASGRSRRSPRSRKPRWLVSCSIGCGSWGVLSPILSANRSVHGGNTGSIRFVQQTSSDHEFDYELDRSFSAYD